MINMHQTLLMKLWTLLRSALYWTVSRAIEGLNAEGLEPGRRLTLLNIFRHAQICMTIS